MTAVMSGITDSVTSGLTAHFGCTTRAKSFTTKRVFASQRCYSRWNNHLAI